VSAPVVCISRSTGAEGEAVGRAVAERLGFRHVDDEVIEQAAEWAELAPAFVADVERRKPFFARMLGSIFEETSVPRLPSGESARSLPADADLRALISSVLGSFADQGSVVIVAHAASFALAQRGVLRVLVTASTKTRSERVAAAKGIDESQASRQIASDDADRADYLKRFYQVDRELPTHYDLVVNTDALTSEQAADIVVAAAR
jgi:Cytidylate kinase-like family